LSKLKESLERDKEQEALQNRYIEKKVSLGGIGLSTLRMLK
jgi:hypothetical protein